MKITLSKMVMLLIALTNAVCATGVATADDLREGFQSPPPSARPELFWDWMHDLVSREGITHNLEAMKRNGFSGAMIMLVGDVDAGFNPTHKMPNPVKCMSPEFFEHWKFAAEEANRLGLTLISQCGPGWCHSGGPWITPEQAVQHLDFSEISVTGPVQRTTFLLEQKRSEAASIGYHAALTARDTPLLESGLLGPVTLQTAESVQAK